MRLGLKILMVLGLTLALLVPLMMIRGTINERQAYREEAVRSVAASYAGEQTVAGPVLVVPYTERREVQRKNDKGQAYVDVVETSAQALYFPKTLAFDGRMQPSVRRLGLHEVRVYELSGHLVARFEATLPLPSQPGATLRLGQPVLSYGVRDVRGLVGAPKVSVAGRGMQVEQGLGYRPGPGVHVALAEAQPGATLAFDTRMDLTLGGTEALAIVPLGDSNRIAVDSPWPHPQFNGAFLPRKPSIGGKGFHAEWEISSLATGAQAQFVSGLQPGGGASALTADAAMPGIVEVAAADDASGGNGRPGALDLSRGLDAAGISLVEPVNVYSQADRATKYGVLFVVLTFTGFFMFELIKQLRVHPIQYLLVGLALAVFFLLLVSLSEHIAFGWAYACAAVACIGLLGFYVSFVLRSRVRGIGFAAMLGLLYAALYGLLVSEDNALVLGAGLLFLILAAIMVITRKVDWYQVQAMPVGRTG